MFDAWIMFVIIVPTIRHEFEKEAFLYELLTCSYFFLCSLYIEILEDTNI